MKKVVLLSALCAALVFSQDLFGQMRVGIKGAFALPAGTFNGGNGNGYGGVVFFDVVDQFNIGLRLDAAFYQFSEQSAGVVAISNQPVVETTSQIRIVPVRLGGNYFIGLGKSGNIKLYLGAMAGLYFRSASVNANGELPDNFEISGDEDKTIFGLAPQGGFLLPIAKNVSLDLSVSYDSRFGAKNEFGPTPTINYWRFEAGIGVEL